jgi:hypothetical protein
MVRGRLARALEADLPNGALDRRRRSSITDGILQVMIPGAGGMSPLICQAWR